MKALRIVGISLLILLGLVAAGIGILHALFDGDKLKAELSRAVAEKTGRTLDIAGTVGLSVWPELSLRLGNTRLSEPGGKETFAALDSARVAVAVMPLFSRQVQVRRIELDGLKATVVKRKDGRLSIADLVGGDSAGTGAAKVGSAPAAGGATPLQFDIAGLGVANAQLTWRDENTGATTALTDLDIASGRIRADGATSVVSIDALDIAARGKSGNDAFELRLEAPALTLSPEKSAAETLKLSATLSGTQRTLAARLVLGGVAGSAKTLRIGSLGLELEAKAGDTAVRGRIESPVAADMAAQTLALEDLSGKVEIVHPKMPVQPLVMPIKGRLRTDLAKQSAALELATAFDESKIALTLAVTKFSPLALGIDLGIDRLNVDKYLPPAPARAAAETTPATAPAREDRLDFSALRGHDLRGAVRIGSLQVAKLKLARVDAKFRLAGGRLDVAPFSLDLYEGSTRGSLMLNAAGNQLALRQELAGVRINPLLKDLADKDLLDGRGNVAIDISSRGESVAAMKKALAGSASFNLKDGAVKGFNLAQALRDIKGKLGAKQDSTRQAQAGDKTDFSELGASLKIANGVARNDDLSMKSPFIRLSGAGNIDIGGDRMDYLAKASVVKDASGQGGQDLAHLKGLTVPVRISGPFEKLSYTLELGGLVAEAAKARVEEKKEEIKAKAQDQVKEKLKGLFGR